MENIATNEKWIIKDLEEAIKLLNNGFVIHRFFSGKIFLFDGYNGIADLPIEVFKQLISNNLIKTRFPTVHATIYCKNDEGMTTYYYYKSIKAEIMKKILEAKIERLNSPLFKKLGLLRDIYGSADTDQDKIMRKIFKLLDIIEKFKKEVETNLNNGKFAEYWREHKTRWEKRFNKYLLGLNVEWSKEKNKIVSVNSNLSVNLILFENKFNKVNI